MMLVYPHNSVPESMAQLVPCSGGLLSQPQQQQQDFVVGLGAYGGQTVPSSPTFSTWNYSPPSYWSEGSPCSSSSATSAIKIEPNGTFECSAGSSSLEELLDDYTYEPVAAPAAAAAQIVTKSEGHALLRQCLRPATDDCHLEFLNQIGSAIASSQPPEMSQPLHISVKTEKVSYWNPPEPVAVQQATNSTNPAAQGLASVLTLVMEQVNEEVRSTCEILGVSPNPSEWSADDVRAWLLWTSRQCALGPFPLERFNMEGAALASLTEEEFRTRAPQGGDTLYAKLDIWRSAWNQRKAAAAAAAVAASTAQSPVTTPSSQPSLIPTIQVDEASDMSDLLAWFNTPQDLQQQPSASMLSVPNHHTLAVPSPASTASSHHGALSPYSDHSGHSCSEDMTSELEDLDEEDDGVLPHDQERAASSASSRAAPSPNGSHIHLWQFLKELLSQPAVHGSAIRWLDRSRGVFKIEDSVRVARLWGKRKNRPAMNYDKLSRSIRQYYRKGIMKKTERSQRLVYQFCHPYAL